MSTLITLSLAEMLIMVEASLRSNTPLHIIGDPGIGKTAVIEGFGKARGVSVVSLILSQSDPSDTGGVPVPVTGPDGKGAIVRLPIGPIREASERPVILFLDEYSQASSVLQGASLTLINERRAGDFRLHPDTRIILASNPPETSANGQEITPPALNRMTHIRVSPTLDEVQTYLYTVGAEGSTLRSYAIDYAATLSVSPGLLQASAPAGVAASGRPWASPRAIERAIRMVADLTDMGQPDNGNCFNAALAGNLGDEVAGTWQAIRRVRDRLPSREEILNDPAGAKLPVDTETGIAALGVIAQVALKDAGAAWVYAERLSAEIRIAAGRALLKYPVDKSKHAQQATRARAKVLGSVGSAMSV